MMETVASGTESGDLNMYRAMTPFLKNREMAGLLPVLELISSTSGTLLGDFSALTASYEVVKVTVTDFCSTPQRSESSLQKFSVEK